MSRTRRFQLPATLAEAVAQQLQQFAVGGGGVLFM